MHIFISLYSHLLRRCATLTLGPWSKFPSFLTRLCDFAWPQFDYTQVTNHHFTPPTHWLQGCRRFVKCNLGGYCFTTTLNQSSVLQCPRPSPPFWPFFTVIFNSPVANSAWRAFNTTTTHYLCGLAATIFIRHSSPDALVDDEPNLKVAAWPAARIII